MKRTVLVFGLISGAISTLMVLTTMPFVDRIGFDTAEIIGYTTMILSFLLVFAGVRSYRDNVCGGAIGFGKAFGVGILITLVSCAMYVVTWEILYFKLGFMHDFFDKYGEYIVEKARASGASAAAVQAQADEMAKFKQLYENPLYNAAFTFLEPFPVGVLMTLIAAAVLKKRSAISSSGPKVPEAISRS